MEKPTYLTQNGLDKLQAELNHLKSEKRQEIAKGLKEIKILNEDDIDSEYLGIKNQQAFVEGRIRLLEMALFNAILLEPSGTIDIIELGSTVVIGQDGFENETFTIVSTFEANPRENKISEESPFGRALIGKCCGDMVEVFTPEGFVTLKAISVN